MTGGRLFLIAMIIASIIAPAARSENCQPTAQIWVNAFWLPAQPSRLADAWREDILHADKILIVVRDGADTSRPHARSRHSVINRSSESGVSPVLITVSPRPRLRPDIAVVHFPLQVPSLGA
jgi:hypothetical protein